MPRQPHEHNPTGSPARKTVQWRCGGGRTGFSRVRAVPADGSPSDAASVEADARPSQLAQANELWEQMLALCAPVHRPLLLLKRQGCTLAEIAAKTGYHPSSVRRIFYDLASQLAARKGPSA